MNTVVRIPTGERRKIEGTLLLPDGKRQRHPAVLFLHGWGSSRQKHLLPAERLCEVGFVALAIDLRGHGKTEKLENAVTARDNLRDAVAAYDFLTTQPEVDKNRIGVGGYSYGGFLGILLSAERKVRWLAVRSPALYRDKDLNTPKAKINRRGLMAFRRRRLSVDDAAGLRAAAAVRAHVLVIEAQHDRIIPHQAIKNYMKAFRSAKSLTYRVIRGADHAMSKDKWYLTAVDYFLEWLRSTT